MAKRLFGIVVLFMMVGGQASAQQFPPGYVDPAPILAAVSEEIGEANLRCVLRILALATMVPSGRPLRTR